MSRVLSFCVYATVTCTSVTMVGQAKTAPAAIPAGQTAADTTPSKKYPLCSTQIANSDCTLAIDRYFPLTYPSIQMRKKATLHVKLNNSFPFERVALTLTNVPTGTPADQTQNLASSIFPSLKGMNFVQWTGKMVTLDAALLDSGIAPSATDIQDEIKKFENDLRELNKQLFQLYAQVGEVNGVIPAECEPAADRTTLNCTRDVNIPEGTPKPWLPGEFQQWRHLMMCEAAGARCDELDKLQPPFTKLLSTVNGDLKILSQICKSPETIDTSTLLTSVTCPSPTLVKRDADYNTLQAYQAELTSVSKDLTNLLQNLLTYPGPQASSQQEWAITEHGTDPYFVPQPVYAITVLNQVGSTTLVSTTAPKSMTTITVFFYEPIFEVSTGVLFSTVPNRTFANQTKIDQVSGVPTSGDVYIAKTLSRPAIEPFVAANWRIGRDVRWLGKRRQAVYGTGLLAFNPYVNLLDYGVGFSYSWRSIMFTPMYHAAHDTRLTQGLYTGEVFCNQTAAHDSVPKCSGSPPAPATEKYLTSAFALGISIRPLSLFSSSK